jgi:hypothetical protein
MAIGTGEAHRRLGSDSANFPVCSVHVLDNCHGRCVRVGSGTDKLKTTALVHDIHSEPHGPASIVCAQPKVFERQHDQVWCLVERANSRGGGESSRVSCVPGNSNYGGEHDSEGRD